METTADVRTVEVKIEVEESGPLTAGYGDKIFQPTRGVVTLDAAGEVRSVVVDGPVLTPTGRLHNSSTRSWSWTWRDYAPTEAWPPRDVPVIARHLVRHVLADTSKLDPQELELTQGVLVEATGLRLTDEAVDAITARDDLVAAIYGAGPGNPDVLRRLMDELARELIGEPWPDPRGKTGLRMILAEATRRGWLLPEEG